MAMSGLNTPICEHLLALERKALARWCNGDPTGFLEICADDVVYFDPFRESRIEGRKALKNYYDSLAGSVRADRFEMVDPHVHATTEMAVLTFQFVSSYEGGCDTRWQCTEVYRRVGDTWKIIATHWSFANGQK
jgi:ketosteroid isomerase-like protein